MTKMSYHSAVDHLKQSKTNIKCPELIKILTRLGFEVHKGASGNHHTFTHPGIDDFMGSNFDCGHGRYPTVLPRYVEKIIKTLEKYRDSIDV